MDFLLNNLIYPLTLSEFLGYVVEARVVVVVEMFVMRAVLV